MGRKLIIPLALAALWLVVLSVPTWRAQFITHMGGYGAHAHGALCSLGVHCHQEWSQRRLDKLAKELPNDVRVQAIAAEHPYDQWDSREVVKGYDSLLARFPREPWLYANALRYRSLSLWDDRPERYELDGPPRYVRPRPPASLTELKEAILIAGKARLLEPDNAFFDLVRAYCLFCERRDDEALAALHAAAGKPHYSVHPQANALARVYVAELEIGRGMLLEEKWALWATTSVPQLSQHLYLARLAIWHAKKARDRGDHERALQIHTDLMRAGRRIRDDAYCIVECVGSITLQAYNWSWQGSDPSPEEKEAVHHDHNRELLLVSEKAATYAKEHGRADLAKEIRREAQRILLLRQRGPGFPKRPSPFWVPTEAWLRVVKLWWFGVPWLTLALVNLLSWLPLTALLWGRRVVRQRLNPLDVTGALLFSVWLPFSLLYAGFRMPDGGTLEQDSRLAHIPDTLAMQVALATVLAGGAYCASVTSWRYRRALRPSGASGNSMPYSPNHRVLVAAQPSSPAHPFSRVLNWGLSLAALASWLSVVLANIFYHRPSPIEYRLNIALFFTVAWLVWWRVRALLSYPPSAQNIAACGLYWFRRMLAIWIVIASVGYFGTLVAAWPDRRMADERMERVINEGEMALVRETAVSQP